MSGGGGGVGGPTVSQEPGVKKEPLLIAGVVIRCSLTSLAGGQPAETVQLNQLIKDGQWSVSISRRLRRSGRHTQRVRVT